MNNPLQKIAELIDKETPYTGGPIKYFELVGRDTFITLLQNGLRPDHKILDFGCGALRLGYWIVRFMDKGKYYGIEPVKKMLEAGKKYSLGEEIIYSKQPKFSHNNSCDFSVFGVKFDFVVARSILTHTTPAMLRKIIKQFSENGTEKSVMLASYWPIENKFPQKGENGDELDLNDWRFIKVVKYSFETISSWSEEFGIKVSKFESAPPINGQVWLKFELIQASTKPVTPVPFTEFLEWKPDGKNIELHGGLIVERQTKAKHEEIIGFLATEFTLAFRRLNLPYFIPKQALVKVAHQETAYSPDILIINKENLVNESLWDKYSTVQNSSSIPLVVEVVSSNWRDDYLMKVRDYEEIGIVEYWIVDYLGLGGKRYIGNPKLPTISIYYLLDGEYQVTQFREKDVVESPTFTELNLTVEQIFSA